jgi:ABC-type multidrug transport system fused ATPase/permease subunit
VLPLLDAKPDIDPDVGRELTRLDGDISLTNVHFAYQMRPNQKVLRGVNLDIKRGQVCAIVGRSGGGKSTLINLMMRFYDPADGSEDTSRAGSGGALTSGGDGGKGKDPSTAGFISVDGHKLTELNLRSVHRQCGLVAQDTQLFGSSIRDNIAYGTSHHVTSLCVPTLSH